MTNLTIFTMTDLFTKQDHTFGLHMEDDNLLITNRDGDQPVYLGSLWLNDGKLTLGRSERPGDSWEPSDSIPAAEEN